MGTPTIYERGYTAVPLPYVLQQPVNWADTSPRKKLWRVSLFQILSSIHIGYTQKLMKVNLLVILLVNYQMKSDLKEQVYYFVRSFDDWNDSLLMAY